MDMTTSGLTHVVDMHPDVELRAAVASSECRRF
jgi:hypothetical protein